MEIRQLNRLMVILNMAMPVAIFILAFTATIHFTTLPTPLAALIGAICALIEVMIPKNKT